MQITYSVRNAFFDRPAVVQRLKKARVRALSRAGAFVRTRARSSLRRRKSASAPGSPPSVHAKGRVSLKTILFAFDSANESVVIGPVALNSQPNTILGLTTTVPGLHERGETAVIGEHRYMPDGSRMTPTGPTPLTQWRRTDRRRTLRAIPGYRLETRKRTARYPARPFMGPALAAEAPNFPDLFAKSIR